MGLIGSGVDSETNTIAGFGSIMLESSLTKSHPVGTVVQISQAPLNPAVCFHITNKDTCISSKDSRSQYLDQPCTWCCGSTCLPGTNDQKCQPHDWLLERSDYSGTGQNGRGYNTCAAPTPTPSPTMPLQQKKRCPRFRSRTERLLPM